MKKKILMWGTGSQARLLLQMIEVQELGTVTHAFNESGDCPEFLSPEKFISTFDGLINAVSEATHFVIAIGNHYGLARSEISQALKNKGLKALSVIHPTAYFDDSVKIGNGVVMMPHVTINSFSTVEDYVILNTNCTLDHEALIGMGSHIMGGAALAGRVSVGRYATVGTNATIIPDIKIGQGAYVGAGAVVVKDIEPNTVVTGVPAKYLKAAKHPIHRDIIDKLEAKGTQ